jgi:hypothetical protein
MIDPPQNTVLTPALLRPTWNSNNNNNELINHWLLRTLSLNTKTNNQKTAKTQSKLTINGQEFGIAWDPPTMLTVGVVR